MSKLLERSIAARTELEDCIVELLDNYPDGLGNAEIARKLCLESDFKGQSKNYLTYSLLGGLLEKAKVERCEITKLYTRTTENASCSSSPARSRQ